MDAEQAAEVVQDMTGKKRRRLTGHDNDGVLDGDEDVQYVEQIFHQAVDKQDALGCKWPNGAGHVMQALTEEIPDHYWIVIRKQSDNYSIAQPANHVFVRVFRDFIALGYPKN